MKKFLFPLLFLACTAYGQYSGVTSSIYAFSETPTITGLGTQDAIALLQVDHGNLGSAEDFSALVGYHKGTLDDSPTLTLSDFAAGPYISTIVIDFTQDATGSRTITWPAEVVSAPSINPIPSTTTRVYIETADGGTTITARSDYREDALFCLALSDESTPITTGAAKVTFRAPYAFTITNLRLQLNTASATGLPTVNIKEDGTTIFSTKLSIDEGELTSKTAGTVFVLSDRNIADDAILTFDQDIAGDGAASGEKLCVYGYR